MPLPLTRSILLLGVCAPFCVAPLLAQRAMAEPPDPPRPASAPRPQIVINGRALRSGAMLGVTLRTPSGADDTLGVLVQEVQADSPADKAGIRDGARLVRVDGIDLRLDPRDLGDSAAELLPESRLRRAIAAKAPGDGITLDVRQGGRTESKRITLGESPTVRMFGAVSQGARRVLGVGFAQRGSMRDTAGLLITSLTDGGAAEKAGLSEGDRIVSIDGVDLRVPAADAGSSEGVEARIARLRRALDGARDDQAVRLEVLSEGRRRTVSVTPQADAGWSGFSISPAQMGGMAADIRASINRNMALTDDDRRDIERARSEAVREGQRARDEARRELQRTQRERANDMREAQREMRDAQRELSRTRVEIERTDRDDRPMRTREDDDEDDVNDSRPPAPRALLNRRSEVIRGRTDGATLSLDGLALASVDRDFGQQFGKGAERGALVVRARDNWEPLRAGDVILSIEGRSVRDGTSLDVSFDRSREQRLEIIRNGRVQTVSLSPRR